VQNCDDADVGIEMLGFAAIVYMESTAALNKRDRTRRAPDI
jgi:hypothetical protein